MIKVALSGINGRMGQMLLKAVLAAPDMELSAALGHSGSSAIGKDAGVPSGITTGVTVTDDIESLRDCDVLIDFSRPEATLTYLPVCAASGTAVVIGTTGFTAEEKKTLEAASESVPVLLAPNTSLGVNAVFKLIEEAARLLSDVDVEIFEMHHRNKVDAPSGTALEMGRRVAQARGQNFDEVAVLSREGHTGPRKNGTIGFAALRGGDVVGKHTVIFAGTGEQVEITHNSTTREGYAQGALTAARFLSTKDKGYYSMSDVLRASR